MSKKYLIIIFISLLINALAYPASDNKSKNKNKSDGREDKTYLKAKNSNFKKGFDAMKQAKKYEKKRKKDKSQKKFNDAVKYFTGANDENPNQPDILNYLGYSFRKVGDLVMAEIYYLQGLEINPKHTGINEHLGELYVQTNRIDKAKERLKVLKDCNCKEFEELESTIKLGTTKY